MVAAVLAELLPHHKIVQLHLSHWNHTTSPIWTKDFVHEPKSSRTEKIIPIEYRVDSDLEETLSTSEYTQEPKYEATSNAMDAFLQAQTKFLEQQEKFAEDEDKRKKEIHEAQLKELEERQKLLKLQEDQSEETKLQRKEKERTKQKIRQADHMEKWNNGDQADAYLSKFETVMMECEILKEQ